MTENPRNDDYLWEGTGEPDPELRELENALRPLRHQLTALPDALAAGRRRRSRWLLPLAAAAALVLVSASVRLIFTPEAPTPTPGMAWSVSGITGLATVDDTPLASGVAFGVGQWLETEAGATVRVDVAEQLGTVTVHEESRVRLLASTAATEHRLELDRGVIEAFITAPPRLFFVDTASATAVDMGCAYRLECDEDGNGRLEVTLGWVALERDGRTTMSPADSVCLLRAGRGPGTPFFDDAGDELRDALERFDFDGGAATDLQLVLDHARPRDTLTLWHLLPRTAVASRRLVLDRMLAMGPLPGDVTEAGVLRLDQPMLDAWWDELELTW